jgi:hypothetical protein
MTPTSNLLCRVLEALRESQTLHELSYRLGVDGGVMEAGDTRRCQAILEEHSGLVVDVERALLDELFQKRGAA